MKNWANTVDQTSNEAPTLQGVLGKQVRAVKNVISATNEKKWRPNSGDFVHRENYVSLDQSKPGYHIIESAMIVGRHENKKQMEIWLDSRKFGTQSAYGHA